MCGRSIPKRERRIVLMRLVTADELTVPGAEIRVNVAEVFSLLPR
jgi:hypothetical protein